MSRTFKTPKGTELPLMDIKGKPYLSVQHRIMWFREDKPEYSIETEIIKTNDKETLAKATIKDPNGRIVSTAHKTETQQGFADHLEKSESSAVGRALGFLGYGTQFALDLEEGERLAEAPTNEKILINHGNTHTISNYSDDPGSYVITFGKHKNKTISDWVNEEGPGKVNSYIHWLENDAKTKKKPLSDAAQELIDTACAYMGHAELDKAVPKDKNLNEKLSRLKNDFHPQQEDTPFPIDSDNLPF